MEGEDVYVESLEQALERKRTHLESSTLPGMRENLRLFLTSFEEPYNILLKKGLIREDQYRHEEKQSEITIPPREPIAPANLHEQMGIRLSRLHGQLDFVIGYYELSLSFLTLQRLRRLADLVRYIDFSDLGPESQNVNSAALGQLTDRVLKGSDPVASGIVRDGLRRLVDVSRRLLRGIADVVLYQRERYKLELRSAVIPAAKLDASAAASDPEGALDAVRSAARSVSFPVYKELVAELLAEDYPVDPADGGRLRSKVLERLKVAEPKKVAAKPAGPAPREFLIEALRALVGTEGALRAALKTVRDNEALVARAPMTLAERMRRFLARAARGKADGTRYEIEYQDEARGISKLELVVWSEFLDEAAAALKSLQALAVRDGPADRKIRTSSDDQLFETVNALGLRLALLSRRLAGLGTLFRSQVAPAYRSQFHSVHGDLVIVRNAVARANRRKHDYVARKEEAEQFRKLGIAPPGSAPSPL